MYCIVLYVASTYTCSDLDRRQVQSAAAMLQPSSELQGETLTTVAEMWRLLCLIAVCLNAFEVWQAVGVPCWCNTLQWL
jgi:hypothetical protein